MASTYTETQEAIRKIVRDFAEKEVKPGAQERDRTGEFDHGLFRRLGELGITGINHPEEYGGSNAGFLAWNLAIEELSRADAAFGLTTFVGNAAMVPEQLTEEEKEAWKQKYVLPVIMAEAITAGAITEPDAGSDTRGIKTTAVLDGDEWVINGTKAFCTNAGLDNCVYVLVLCITDKEKWAFDTIIVPKGTPGFTVAPKYPKMGVRSAYTSELYFDDCRVPATYVTGVRGTGRRWFMRVGFAQGRITTTSVAMGIHQACLEESMNYALQRVAFGRPIYGFQYVQGMVVDMYTDLEISRLLRDKAARLMDEGEAPLLEACTLKYWGCEAAVRAANSAVQIFGGLGYIDETPVSRYYRDVRWVTIGDGTSQIQKLVIAREIAGRARVIED